MKNVMVNSPLRFGYFEDFSDPTFMFFGDHDSLRALYEILLSLPTQDCIQIDADPRFKPVSNEGLNIRLTPVAEGMRHQASSQSNFFEWRLSASQALHFAEQVRGVIDADQPCHDYLDTETLDEAVVVVSKGEYPESWPAQ